MNIRLLKNQDIEKLEEYLDPYKTECMFICSNLKAAGVEYKGADFEGEYFGFFDDTTNKLLGAIVHYWNGNVMMHASSQNILKQLASYLKKNIKRPVGGVLGIDFQASHIIKELNLPDSSFRINNKEALYQLNLPELNLITKTSNCKIVSANDMPRESLRKWMIDYEIEALGSNQSNEIPDRVDSKIDRICHGDSFTLVKNNIPVALAAFNARLEYIVQVGPVWTPIEHRNKGFAKTLLSHILLQEKNKGTKKAILFTNNPAAIKAYIAIGFKKIGDYRLSLLKKDINLTTLSS